MDEFLRSLSTANWWISVVLVGVALNLLSAYVKPPLDRCFSRISSRWRSRSEQKRARRAAAVKYMRRHPDEQIHALLIEMRLRLRAQLEILMGLLLISGAGLRLAFEQSAGYYVVVAIGAWIAFLGLGSLNEAQEEAASVNQARYGDDTDPAEQE